MALLSDLKLVAGTRPTRFDPVLSKRRKLIERIEDQIHLARAYIDGTPYMKAVLRRVKDPETDSVRSEEVSRRVVPWWWTDKDGKYQLAIKYGTKVIELAKGKPIIQADSLQQVIIVLNTLSKATHAGELDAVLLVAGSHLKSRFKKP
jgi:hypothetical protein